MGWSFLLSHQNQSLPNRCHFPEELGSCVILSLSHPLHLKSEYCTPDLSRLTNHRCSPPENIIFIFQFTFDKMDLEGYWPCTPPSRLTLSRGVEWRDRIRWFIVWKCARFGEFWLFCNEQVWTFPLQFYCEVCMNWQTKPKRVPSRDQNRIRLLNV